MHGTRNHEGELRSRNLATSLDLRCFDQPEGETSAFLRFRLRQFDQHYLPIDLRHCTGITVASSGRGIPEKG